MGKAFETKELRRECLTVFDFFFAAEKEGVKFLRYWLVVKSIATSEKF
jgi:hypothetical protein